MISRSTIDKVLDLTLVEEVIGDFVQLKKSGANYKGLSPFTDERTPSFTVSPAKQIWKDFSSGKGGNAISFLMEHDHYSYPDAIRYLAKKYNVEIEETELSQEQKANIDKKESLLIVNTFAEKYFHQTLNDTEKGKAIGLSYFKHRGLTDQTIEFFKLGYCLDQWDGFTKKALKEGHSLNLLNELGLTIVKENKQFDRFKGRVMFPIHSISGRVIGFGGRILTNDKKTAKYINSPDSVVYHKSKVLYGFYQAKQFIVKEDVCYLVEGYTDVLQMYQRGIKNIVASGGTALTTEQIRLMRRLSKNVTILYDGDAAGQRASLRGIDLVLEQGLNVRICSFPEGEDPDSFARANTLDEINTYIENHTEDFIHYKANLLLQDTKGDPIKKAEITRSIIESIHKIADPIKQEIYIQRCAAILEVSQQALFSTLAQMDSQSKTNKKNTTPQPSGQITVSKSTATKTDFQHYLEQKIIQVLLLYGGLEVKFEDQRLQIDDDGNETVEDVISERKVFEKIYLDLQTDEIVFANEQFQKIYDIIISSYQSKPDITQEELLKKFDVEETNFLSSIIMEEDKYPSQRYKENEIYLKTKEEGVNRLAQDMILDFRNIMIYNLISELQERLKEELSQEEIITILEDISGYKNLSVILANKYQRRVVQK